MDIKKLEYYIKVLTDNYTIKLDEINKYPAINDSYIEVTEIEPQQKDDIRQLILKQYRPTQILPETVGSYLFGCFQNNYGDIPAECSPLCASGIKNNDDLVMEKCQNQIYMQYLDEVPEKGSRFVKLGKSKATQGFAFVKLNFIGFTLDEKEFFMNNGVYKIQILVTKDSKHHTILKMRDINDIPIIEGNRGQYYLTTNSTEEYSERVIQTEDSDGTYVYIALAIMIIGIMLVMMKP